MRLTIVQSSLAWEDPLANRAMFSQKLAPLRGLTDLVVLPEMFTTGFSMNAAALAEPMGGPTFLWMHHTAAELDAAIAGSFICIEGNQFFNRLLFMRPDGSFEFYDKKHLFRLAAENETFSPGAGQVILEWRGWRIRPLVCYDLRFPVWSATAKGQEAPELILYIANWPTRRAHHWRSLLIARAIENQAFVAGVNIVGTDGAGLEYVGDSAIVDFAGQPIFQISGEENVRTAKLTLGELGDYRRQLPFLQDADLFELS